MQITLSKMQAMAAKVTNTQESREAHRSIGLRLSVEADTFLQRSLLYGLSCALRCGMGIDTR